MKQIKNILFLSVFLCIPIACNNPPQKTSGKTSKTNSIDKKKASFPFGLEISVDVIGLELAHYKDQFKKDWNTNVHAQVIIEEAEILVQTAPIEFQNELKTKVINIFAKNNALIQFTTHNKIIPKIKTISDDIQQSDEVETILEERKKNKEKKIKLPKKHKKKKLKAKQIVAPKKIHGARRTMKRLKREAEQRRKREYEAIRAKIAAKNDAVMKAKRDDFFKEEARIRENMIREHATERDELLHKIQMDNYRNLAEEHL
jgi:hypothetical protein